MIKLKHMNSIVKNTSFLRLIFIYFLIPILMVSISAFGVYKYYKDLLQKELETNYLNTLSTLAQTLDNSLLELQNTTTLLSSDNDLYTIFYSERKLTTSDAPRISTMTTTLAKFKATKSLIDSVYILHKDSDEVLDTSGTYNASDFFARNYFYEKYNKDFWMNLKVNNNYYSVLKPSTLSDLSYDTSVKRSVIPFVTSTLKDVKSNNLFVINLSAKAIGAMLEKYKFSPEGTMAIIDHTGIVYSSSDESIKDSITTDPEFLTKLSGTNIFEYKIDGKKYMIISFSSKLSKFNDFIYTAFVPYNDFYQRSLSIKRLAYMILLMGVVLSIFAAYLISRRIYNPIGNLVHILSNNADPKDFDKNEVEYLNNQIQKIITNESILKKDLSTIMPLASEQYLIKILTNSDSLLDEDVKNFLNNSQIKFNFPNFSVILIEMNFTDAYYKTYNKDEHSLVVKGFSRILTKVALDGVPNYILNLEKNQLCLLINLPPEENLDKITDSIRNTIDLFDYDKELLMLFVGVGRSYSDFIGMNKSYNEARKALAALSPLNSNRINVYSGECKSSNYQYSINDENKLFNYLIGNYKDEAISFLNQLIEKNYNNNPTEYNIKKFYSSIYDTIVRVFAERELEVAALMGENFVDLSVNLKLMSISDVNNYIFLMVNRLLSVQKVSRKVDIQQITEYIKENYHQDIYLEKLAEHFNTSDKYLSRLFKETMGMGFHDYLTSIRISKSKSLLLETDLSVTKIGEKVGFATHSTFFRMFKKYEGINPTQYRENHTKG